MIAFSSCGGLVSFGYLEGPWGEKWIQKIVGGNILMEWSCSRRTRAGIYFKVWQIINLKVRNQVVHAPAFSPHLSQIYMKFYCFHKTLPVFHLGTENGNNANKIQAHVSWKAKDPLRFKAFYPTLIMSLSFLIWLIMIRKLGVNAHHCPNHQECGRICNWPF